MQLGPAEHGERASARSRAVAGHTALDGAKGLPALLLALWAVLRVPAALLCAPLFANWILVNLIDPVYFTERVIDVASTPFARGLFFLAFACALLVLWVAIRRLTERHSNWLMIAVVAVGLLAVFRATGTSQRMAGAVALIMATNLIPDRFFERLPARLERFVLAVAPGVGELLFSRRYIAWVTELGTGRRFGMTHWLLQALPAVLLASGLTSVLVRSPYLVDVEQALRLPSPVRIIARGDFNWIELDATKQGLLVAGHGVPRILRYDVRNLDRPPLASPVDAGAPQAFAYEPVAGELYTYNARTRSLLILDSNELSLKRSIPIPDLASGDPWIAVHRETNTVTVVSEADNFDGKAFIVLDRLTGELRDQRDIDASSLLLEPATSRLFLSFFRRSNQLKVYDLKTLSISAEVPAPHYVDRMALLKDRRELLLVAPTQSRIFRFDAETLAPKGHINAIFGVRVLAVDEKRNLLLSGSLATGEVAILDLADFRVRSRLYLGPWLRTIEVDSARGVAYISSNGALYELSYGNLR